jgi:DNA-binding NarL/FixJ family response regulator
MHPDPGPSDPVRVVVIDADDRVRESLNGLLCIGDRLCVVGSAGQVGPALDVVVATQPDIVVVDPRLPGLDGGLPFLGRLRAIAPDVRILVLTGSDPREAADLAGAADGVIRKTFRQGDLVAAVLAAARPITD